MILKFISGSTVIDFDWHNRANPYALTAKDGWTPKIAARRNDELGGGLYVNPVLEEITISIFGDSATDALRRLRILILLLDQADRWGRGDQTVSPVLIQYLPNGGRTIVEDVILGRAPDDDLNAVTLSPTFNSALNGYVIENIKVRIVRGGLWLGELDAAVSSSSVSSGAVWSTAHADHHTLSPVIVQWGMPSTTGAERYESSTQLLILSDSSSNIIIQEGEAYAAGGSRFTNVVVANARGGNVLAFQPLVVDTVYTSTTVTSIPSGLATAGQYAIFGSISVDGTGTAQQIRMRITTNMLKTIDTPWVDVVHTGSFVSAEPILLGVVTIPPEDSILQMNLEGIGNSTAVCWVADYFVFVRLSPDVSILSINHQDVQGFGGATREQRVDHALLTALQPQVTFGRTSGTQRTSTAYAGQAILMQRGTNLSGVLLASNAPVSGSYDGQYRQVSSGGAVYSSAFTVQRRRAYLVPE